MIEGNVQLAQGNDKGKVEEGNSAKAVYKSRTWPSQGQPRFDMPVLNPGPEYPYNDDFLMIIVRTLFLMNTSDRLLTLVDNTILDCY